MNIKSLLLGSAAALAVVSGAHAADAIVAAEPEPLEYVRICDAYGKGYFYIPGTETCLQIGGMVRQDVSWRWPNENVSGHELGTEWLSRFELNVNTATDTEYGALKTNTVVRLNWSEGVTDTHLIAGNIQLGGFLIGLADSQFQQFTGYLGDIIHDDQVADGPYELNQITYNFDAGNGFLAVVSLEDTNSAGIDADGAVYSDHYAPNAVVGLGYKAGNWSIKLAGGYDSVNEEGAIKARLDADFGGGFSGWVQGGWNSDGDTTNQYATGDAFGNSWGDWAVWGGLAAQLNEKVKLNGQLAYTDNETFAAAANVVWWATPNLKVMPEVAYTENNKNDENIWYGVIRFQRSF